MDELQFRNALVQTLENYRRCGVSRFVRSEGQTLPADWQAALVELAGHRGESSTDAGARSASLATASASVAGFPAGAAPQMPPTSDRASVVNVVASPGVPTSWSLPVLTEPERQAQLAEIDTRVRACRQCVNIVDFREQTVFGAGTLRPRICFMGEAPGADEDRQGQPFVGRAGQLLTKIINAMKLSREEVYILNALKCRPPQNRTPVPEEIDSCRGFVEAQLEVLQPEFIVCLGAVAVRSILQSTLSIGKLRGQFHNYRGATVVVTYHPSYLLRNEDAKRFVWEDMKMLMRKMGME